MCRKNNKNKTPSDSFNVAVLQNSTITMIVHKNSTDDVCIRVTMLVKNGSEIINSECESFHSFFFSYILCCDNQPFIAAGIYRSYRLLVYVSKHLCLIFLWTPSLTLYKLAHTVNLGLINLQSTEFATRIFKVFAHLYLVLCV